MDDNKVGTSSVKHSNSSNADSMAKIIISGVIAFILAIALTLLTTILAVYMGFLNTNNIITAFNKVDYYNNVLEHFNEKIWDITIPLGLPQEVVEDVVEINQVSRDVKGSLTAGLDQTDYIADVSKLEEKLDENVRNHFASQGTALDENQEAVLKEYKDSVSKEYLKSVEIPLIKYFGNAKNLYEKVMIIGIPVCILLAIVATVLLIKLQKWRHRGLRHVVYSTLAAMLMSSIVPGIILVGGIYKKINLAPEYFYNFIIKYIQGGFFMFFLCAAVWLLISIVLLFMIKNMKNTLKRKSKNRSR